MLFLDFRLGDQRFALDYDSIIEVLPLIAWREIPAVPDAVIGVFDYHGTLVPLVDIRLLAFGASTDVTTASRIALVRYTSSDATNRMLGIFLESGTRLIRRDAEAFVDPPVRSDAAYAGRIAPDADGMIQRVDLVKIVPDDIWERVTPADEVPHG